MAEGSAAEALVVPDAVWIDGRRATFFSPAKPEEAEGDWASPAGPLDGLLPIWNGEPVGALMGYQRDSD